MNSEIKRTHIHTNIGAENISSTALTHAGAFSFCDFMCKFSHPLLIQCIQFAVLLKINRHTTTETGQMYKGLRESGKTIWLRDTANTLDRHEPESRHERVGFSETNQCRLYQSRDSSPGTERCLYLFMYTYVLICVCVCAYIYIYIYIYI